MMTLNDVCKVITCGVAKRPEYFKEGIPFLSSKNVKADRFILKGYNHVSEKDFRELTKHNKPEKEDILYTRVGSFGEAAVIDFDFDIAIFVSLTLIKPKKDKVVSRYLMYYLNSPKIKQLANNSTSGIGVQNLNVGTVRKFPISLPPLDQQKKIAAILDAADAYRQKTKALITKYEELTQSLFLDMFGDPVANLKGYKVISLVDYGSFKNGLNFSRNEEGVTIKYLGVGNFKSLYKIDDLDTLSNIELNSFPSEGYLLKNGDLVFVRSNGNKALVGRCVEVTSGDTKVTFSGFCIRYRVSSSKINPSYLAQLFRNKSFKALMLQGGRGANIQNINQQILASIKIPLPSIALQNQFIDRVQAIEAQKAQAQASLVQAEDLFNSLLQKAFKGELV
jgi:type I restriction enzyme S subunit